MAIGRIPAQDMLHTNALQKKARLQNPAAERNNGNNDQICGGQHSLLVLALLSQEEGINTCNEHLKYTKGKAESPALTAWGELDVS